jgi:hypothetical protein
MKSALKSLPFILVAVGSMHAACDSSETTTGGSGTVTVSSGSGNADLCEGGFPDEFCNALGDYPESCKCFDCVSTAKCLGGCNDDGTCGPGEDCTCIDCYETKGPQCDANPDAVATTDAATVGSGGGGTGGAGTGGAATTGSTTAATTAATTGAGGAGGAGGAP